MSGDDATGFEGYRQRTIEIVRLIHEKTAIPAVKSELGYLAAMQETGFWEGTDLGQLEDLRPRLRALVPFFDGKKHTVVYSHVEDAIVAVGEEEPVYRLKLTGSRKEKKVKVVPAEPPGLPGHPSVEDEPAAQGQASGGPRDGTRRDWGPGDAGRADTHEDRGSVARSLRSPARGHGPRRSPGLFPEFLWHRSLTPPQIRFLDMVTDQLTARGVMEAPALYEPPFGGLHAEGPDALLAGKDQMIEGIFERLRAAESALDTAVG